MSMNWKRFFSRMGWAVFEGVISALVFFAGLKVLGLW